MLLRVGLQGFGVLCIVRHCVLGSGHQLGTFPVFQGFDVLCLVRHRGLGSCGWRVYQLGAFLSSLHVYGDVQTRRQGLSGLDGLPLAGRYERLRADRHNADVARRCLLGLGEGDLQRAILRAGCTDLMVVDACRGEVKLADQGPREAGHVRCAALFAALHLECLAGEGDLQLRGGSETCRV